MEYIQNTKLASLYLSLKTFVLVSAKMVKQMFIENPFHGFVTSVDLRQNSCHSGFSSYHFYLNEILLIGRGHKGQTWYSIANTELATLINHAMMERLHF